MPHLITVSEAHYTLLRDLTDLVERHLAGLVAENARLHVEVNRLKARVEDLELDAASAKEP